jgi:tetratricopeptide (TPR) repeat protein
MSTQDDVFGRGFTGNNNIVAKDTKGNIFYFSIGNITTEQLKSIITSSTTLDTSFAYKDAYNRNTENLNKAIKTKQQSTQVIEDINKIEKEQGRQIQEIQVEDLQISKKDLSLKELTLKGNEHFYKNQLREAIDWYDNAIKQDSNNFDLLFNKAYSLGELDKYNEAIEYYDKALKVKPDYIHSLYNKRLALDELEKEGKEDN